MPFFILDCYFNSLQFCYLQTNNFIHNTILLREYFRIFDQILLKNEQHRRQEKSTQPSARETR